MIELTQREHDLLTSAFQEGTITILSRGISSIANRLVSLGWLVNVGSGTRTFSLTHNGHRALTDGKITI
jgi:hypothetical protein